MLRQFSAREASIPAAVFDWLQRPQRRNAGHRPPCRVTNLVIGNNAIAVNAAGMEAERRGYLDVRAM